MKITWFLCAILIALALYVFYLYTSQIETMTDLESILKQIKEHKKRKKKLKKKGKKKKTKKKKQQIQDLKEEYERLLQQMNDAKSRALNSIELMKKVTNSMKHIKDKQYETRIRTSRNIGSLEEYKQQYDILK